MEGSYVLAARLSDGLRGAGDHRRAEPQWPLEPGRRAAGAHRGGPAGGGGLRQRDAAARHRYPRTGEAAVLPRAVGQSRRRRGRGPAPACKRPRLPDDRKSIVEGKSVSDSLVLGGGLIIKKKKTKKN